jgi:secondary thiamine-phosphate synthase enzyme
VKQGTTSLRVATRGKGLYEFTRQAAQWLAGQGIQTGLLTVFVRHTSASLLIQENADPDVRRDLDKFFERLVPENDPLYVHTMEGPDDMPAHVRAALTATQVSVPVVDGRMVLGTWQGLYLFEHRSVAHQREIVLHVMGE